MQYLGAISKMTEWLLLIPRQTIQYHSNPSLCPNHWSWRNWRMVLWGPTRLSGTNTKKRCPFHHRGLECKSRKSRDTWSNRQVWTWSTKWSRANANRVLKRECNGHSKYPLPTTQDSTHAHHQMTIPKSDWLYSLQLKMENSIQSAKIRLGADCSSDHELLIAKFRLKLKKVGKTTRPFRHDLNQIPYNYTVEVTNSQGIRSDRQSASRTTDRGSWHCTEGSDQDYPQEKEM